jgi:hypothetical protein
MIKKRVTIAIQILLLLCIGGGAGQLHGGESLPSREYKLKAGLIYNLTQFVDYPDRQEGAEEVCFRIGILGQDPFAEEIDILNGKIIQDQKIEVVRYKGVDEVAECRMLFISSSEKAMRTAILDALKEKKILTMSDMDGFSEAGGMIHFITVNNRIRFKVNLVRVRAAGLRLSAHFLKLATIVDPERIKEDDCDPK